MRFSSLLAILIINCTTLERAEYGNTRSGYPDQESWGVKITLTDEGVMRALVKSGHLEKFNDRQYILLDKDVNVDFFDDFEQHIDFDDHESKESYSGHINHVQDFTFVRKDVGSRQVTNSTGSITASFFAFDQRGAWLQFLR